MGSTTLLERPVLTDAARLIIADGFAEIDIDPSLIAEHVPNIKSGIRDMTNDVDTHPIFAEQVLDVDEMGWNQEAGLVRRDDKENKFFFHYQSPQAEWPFPDHEMAERFSPFLESCMKLTTRAREIAQAVARALDAEGGLPQLTPLLDGTRAVTRILRYLPLEGARKENADAYAHIDRAFLTVHWWASEEGLVLFDRKRVAHRVAEKSWDRVAIFPGKKFFGATGGKLGMCGIHGVRDSRAVRTDDRIAVVTFVHAKLSPEAVALIKERRHAFKEAEESCPL